MPGYSSDLEARIRGLSQLVADLSRRVDALEGRRPESASAVPAPDAPHANPRTRPEGLNWIALVGRVFIILGGAYLLRALTDSGRLPDTAGVALGLLYALTWLGIAEYARASLALTRVFHGVAALLVGLPIVWEASARFHVLDAGGSAAALAGVSTLGLGVAAHRQLQSLAVAATAGTVLTVFALAFQTGRTIPYAVPALILGTATWWLGERRQWRSLRWLGGLALDLLLLGLIVRATTTPARESPALVLVVLGTFVTISLGSFAARTLRQRRVSLFESLQTAMVLAIGLGGAATVGATLSAAAPAIVGMTTLVLAAVSYLVPFVAGRHDLPYFTSVGLACVVFGAVMVWRGTELAVVLTVGATIAAVFSSRSNRAVWPAHATILSATAAIASGLLSMVGRVWIPGLEHWPDAPATAWLPIVPALLVLFRIQQADQDDNLAQFTNLAAQVRSAARLLLTFIVAAAVGTAAVLAGGWAMFGPAPNPGSVASLKTTVLAASAIALRSGRRFVGREAIWLSAAALIAGGFKLIVDDFRVSTASTLFIALAIYGVALILVARKSPG